MNIQQLKIIIELSQQRTLVEIAHRLELTQPTVSFHIKKLEEELGVPLVEKQSRNLKMTKACLELVPYARQILELLEEAKRRVIEVNGLSQPKLRIGASHTPATYFLPPFIKQFQKLHPELEVQVRVNQTQTAIEMLRHHQLDLAIISLPDFTIEGLNLHPLVEDRLLLVFAPENRLSSLEKISVEELGRETFLLHESGSTTRTVTDDWVKSTGLRLHHAMELGAIETIKEGIKCNMGIGILPQISVDRELKEGTLLARPLPSYEDRRCICLVHRNEASLPGQLSSFIWFAIENMKQ